MTKLYTFRIPVHLVVTVEAQDEDEALAIANALATELHADPAPFRPHAFKEARSASIAAAGVKRDDRESDEYECSQCGATLYNHPEHPPAKGDDDEWRYEAKLHASDCSWVAARGG
jgi:hypothetical protein